MPKKKSKSDEKKAENNNSVLKERSPSFTGCTSANFHEASRSEYLAHYVFSSFGTSVPVPRQEDTGLDLICTLTERVGQRLWPIATYSVQVKSTLDPWVFADERSVEWIVKHPMPVFLCVVDKKSARIAIYNTWPRFLVWVMPDRTPRLEMVPGLVGDGEILGLNFDANGEMEPWERDDGIYSLSAPIAEFGITDVIDSEFHAKVHSVLLTWIQYDIDNIQRIRAGIKGFRLISQYKTNEPTTVRPVAEWFRPTLSELKADRKFTYFIEHLKWVAKSLGMQGELKGCLRAALLLRHFDALHPIRDELGCNHLLQQLEHDFPSETTSSSEGSYAGLDGLNTKFDLLIGSSIQRTLQQLVSSTKTGQWQLPDESAGDDA